MDRSKILPKPWVYLAQNYTKWYYTFVVNEPLIAMDTVIYDQTKFQILMIIW